MSRNVVNTQAEDGASFLFVQIGRVALSPVSSQAGMADLRESVNWKVSIPIAGT